MDKLQIACAYRLVAELFLYPEDRDRNLIELERGRLTACSEFLTPINQFLQSPAAESTDEYISTLELAPPVPLYLGSYLYDEPESCRGAGMSGRNGYMLELSNIYRHFGVEHTGGEMADFVPVIVEFLSLSLNEAKEDDLGLRRYMVETLLLNGIESLLSALRKYDSAYALLVDALRVALTADVSQMADGPKWAPPSADVEPGLAAALNDATKTNNVNIEKVTVESGVVQ